MKTEDAIRLYKVCKNLPDVYIETCRRSYSHAGFLKARECLVKLLSKKAGVTWEGIESSNWSSGEVWICNRKDALSTCVSHPELLHGSMLFAYASRYINQLSPVFTGEIFNFRFRKDEDASFDFAKYMLESFKHEDFRKAIVSTYQSEDSFGYEYEELEEEEVEESLYDDVIYHAAKQFASDIVQVREGKMELMDSEGLSELYDFVEVMTGISYPSEFFMRHVLSFCQILFEQFVWYGDDTVLLGIQAINYRGKACLVDGLQEGDIKDALQWCIDVLNKSPIYCTGADKEILTSAPCYMEIDEGETTFSFPTLFPHPEVGGNNPWEEHLLLEIACSIYETLMPTVVEQC